MTFAFEHTAIWKRTLAPQKRGDEHAKAREKLRSAYLGMRDKAAALVTLIPQDCKGLTVHDITHLDALWETADLISGMDFDINPAEAFVFGAAVLLHDSAMSVAAFPGGMAEIQKTTEWADAAYSIFRRHGHNPKPELIYDPPPELKDEIVFNVLRAVHAKQAEKLISAKWQLPSGGNEVCLLEDMDLYTSYGATIGRIAHSHHWDIERLTRELRENSGSATQLPGEWSLNEIKVACLLRCADAAHIDHRRAPSMLYALTKPKGIANTHWNFQNKLIKPIVNSESLVYSSGQDFNVSEAASWWLCFDTIKMIDKELSSSDALLQDIGVSRFAARRVFGAESPAILARNIKPNGWRPVDTKIRVSDPVQLAQTLGGHNLYGRGAFAPIRELLQNAVDAVRARRSLERRDTTWGQIRLILEDPKDDSGKPWLHVDDNGVGMSERVLVGPLLDFGRSLWNSPLLQDEFPGLESHGIKPIGKFGIGFFSIFLLGEHVRVVSRPYSAGISEAHVLEFSSLVNRPILRNAFPSDLPTDFVTRISVRIDNNPTQLSEIPERYPWRHPVAISKTINELLSGQIRHLIAALDLQVEIQDRISGNSFIHKSDWRRTTASIFLDELILSEDTKKREHIIKTHEHLVTELKDKNGEHYGRAALRIGNKNYDFNSLGYISVGGFVYHGHSGFDYVGVLTGDTEDVTRNTASQQVPGDVISTWASEQALLIDRKRFQIYDLIRVCHSVLALQGDTHQLPFCFSGGKFITLEEFKILVNAAGHLYLPLNKTYSDNFELLKISEIDAAYFMDSPYSEVIVFSVGSQQKLFDDEVGKTLMAKAPVDITEEVLEQLSSTSGGLLLHQLQHIWGKSPIIRLERAQLFKGDFYKMPARRWVLKLQRE